jgi:hypothetical protein
MAHIRSILPQRGGVSPVDNNTMFLAHYDEHARDNLKGLAPAGHQYSLEFGNGSNSFVEIPDSPHLTGMSALTVEGWAYISSIPDEVYATPIAKASYGPNEYYIWLDTRGSKTVLGPGLNTTGGETSAYWTYDSSLIQGRWFHFAMTWASGDKLRFYIDGVLKYESAGTLTGTVTNGNNPFRIGSSSNPGDSEWPGKMSDVRIWKKQISSDELKMIMNTHPSGDEIDLVGNWKLNEGQGAIAYDYSSYGHDGLFVGNPKWTEGRAIYSLVSGGYPGGTGKGVSLEEGTTNMATPVSYGTYAYATLDGPVTIFNPHNKDVVYKYRRSSATGAARGSKVLPAVTGKTYTMSIVIKVKDGLTRYISPNKTHPEGTGLDISVSTVSSKTENLGDGWFKVTGTYLINSNSSALCRFCFGISDGVIDDDFYVYDLQWEEKPYATSFVDGTREQLNLQYPNPIGGNSEFTISFWAKWIRKGTPNYGAILSIANSTANETNTLDIDAGNTYNAMRFFTYNSTGVTSLVNTDVHFDKEEWMYIAVIRNSTSLLAYINGSLVGTAANTGSFVLGDTISIGKRIGSTQYSDRYTNLVIDELRIDKVARTDAEIQSWYYQGRNGW